MNSIDIFLKYELDNKLFEVEFNDVKLWQYLRFPIYNLIIKNTMNINDIMNEEDNIKNSFSKMLKNFPDLILRNAFFNLKKKEILVFAHPRRILNDKYYECIHTDEMLNELDPKTYYVYEQSYLGNHYKPVNTRNLRYTDYIKLKQGLIFLIYKRLNKYKLNENSINRLKKICADFNKLFNLNIDEILYINLFQKSIIKYKSGYKLYEKLLRKIRPKIIIELVYYGFDRMIVNEIAEKMGIKTVEMQHGTMGKYHLAYNFLVKRKPEVFPNYIFTFGEFWKENTRFPIVKDNIFVTGFNYFERMKQRYSVKINSNYKTILFVSQTTIGNKLSELALKLAKKIDINNYKIIYKLHPSECKDWAKKNPELASSNIEVIDKNKYSIYHYLSLADYQVGCYSTGIFEGLGYNLKTFVYKAYGHEYMETLYNNGYAKLVDNEDQIIESLTLDDFKSYDIDKFWKENSIINIKLNLEKIVSL